MQGKRSSQNVNEYWLKTEKKYLQCVFFQFHSACQQKMFVDTLNLEKDSGARLLKTSCGQA